MSNKTATVIVSREGVQFGPGAWFSHEKITGVPLAILQDPNSAVRSLAAANYHNWVAEALNARPDELQTMKVTVEVNSAMLDEIRNQLPGSERIIFDVARERAAQDSQWGGPGHDDAHSAYDWINYIRYQANQARSEALNDDCTELVDPESYRQRLVKVAALAVAALQSHDRLQAMSEANEGAEANLRSHGVPT